ncbi:MAG: hypothetical protein WCX31_18475 [Salinivirgaceae bacterium]|jgi:hypothetical protein
MKKLTFDANRVSKLLVAICLIFVFSNVFSQQYKQQGDDINGKTNYSKMGTAVSISDDGLTVAIGSPEITGSAWRGGMASIYSWKGTSWVQKGNDIEGVLQEDFFGYSISLSADGNTVAIGAPWSDSTGHDKGYVRVLYWDDTDWLPKGNFILGHTIEGVSGMSIGLSGDGNSLIIGESWNDDYAIDAGQARVYTWNGSNWSQKGDDINGKAAYNECGSAVSISNDGNIIAVASPLNSENGLRAGQIQILQWSGTQWELKGNVINGEASNNYFGSYTKISTDGNVVACSQSYGDDRNAVRIFNWDGNIWSQKGTTLIGEADFDYFGSSLSLNTNGNVIAIGAPNNDGTSDNSGSVRIYNWNGSDWNKVGEDMDGEAQDDRFGTSVSVSSDGSSLAVGAPLNDGNGSNSGHARIYKLCSPTISSMDITACFDYISPSSNYVWTSSGIYTDTIQNITGCDSIITIDLTINFIDNLVVQNNNTLTANSTSVSYQWLNCDDNYSIIPGATEQIFTAQTSGNYAVQLIENSCVDTSQCYNVNSTSYFDKNKLNNLILCYSNPSTGTIEIKFENYQEKVNVKVLNSVGLIIFKSTDYNVKELNLNLAVTYGVYMVEIISGENNINRYKIFIK